MKPFFLKAWVLWSMIGRMGCTVEPSPPAIIEVADPHPVQNNVEPELAP